jgi:hypothetical protein
MPSDKALGLDGFTRAFFKACWEIIKDDVTDAINSLFAMNSQNFEFLNSANIVLLQKKTDANILNSFFDPQHPQHCRFQANQSHPQHCKHFLQTPCK